MASMVLTEDTPRKLVLQLNSSQPRFRPLTWSGCIRPALAVNGVLILILAWTWARFMAGSQPWLSWAITAAALLAEVSLGIILWNHVTGYNNSAKEAKVDIDLDTQQAVRFERLHSGRTRQHALRLEQATRVLVHADDLGHSITVALESRDRPPFNVSSDVFLDPGPMIELGRKIGTLIAKPVVFLTTDAGTLVSEVVIGT